MRKHKSDRVITLLTFMLMLVGLIVIYVIGPMRVNYENIANGTNTDVNFYFFHQLVTIIASIMMFFVAFKMPYEKIEKVSKWIFLLGLAACGLLAILAAVNNPLASCQNGACRWFNLGFFNFQPAELLKLGLILYLSSLVAKRREEGKLDKSDFWLPFIVFTVPALLLVIVAQSDFGTAAVMMAIILAILWLGKVDWKKILVVVFVILVGGVFAIVRTPHRMERMMTFSGGGDNYHIENALIAVGTGGFFGVGVGNSVQATGYLPESINDSVFAVMGETFGFVGLIFVLVIFMVLLYRILKIADNLSDDSRGLVAIGVWTWLASHMVINISAMIGLIPLTGITLPFLSYGGTSMMFMAIGLGIVAQLSCYTSREVKHEDISSGRRIRGTHHSSRRRGA